MPFSHKTCHAVVDVGSNSIRLVVFQEKGGLLIPVLNESKSCGLGRREKSGNLSHERMERALKIVQRFMLLCQEFRVEDIHVLATSAVREAPNGRAFCEGLSQFCPVLPQILSGEEEGILAAEGVLYGFPQASGLVLDMGGGSVELVHLKEGEIQESISLPIGPLSLQAYRSEERGGVILAELKKAQHFWKDSMKVDTLFAVGGSPRALGYISLMAENSPTEIVHGATIATKRMLSVSMAISEKFPKDFPKIAPKIRRRRHVLPTAGQVMAIFLKQAKPKNVVMCGFGVREGFFRKKLDLAEKARSSPVEESCRFLAQEQERPHLKEEKLFQWVSPHVLKDKWKTSYFEKLLRSLCILADLGWLVLPEYRAEFCYQKILHAPQLVATHPERFILALGLYHRYGGILKREKVLELRSWLEAEEIFFAETCGNLLSFFNAIAGSLGSSWKDIQFDTSNPDCHVLILKSPLILPDDIKELEKDYFGLFHVKLKVHL